MILLPFLGFAHIIQDDVAVIKKTHHTFNYVCEKSGYPDSPLIEISTGTILDCMSKKVDVGQFCDRELVTDPYYLRGYIDQNKKEVVCVTGKKVLFKYLCISKKAPCSMEALNACKYIQDKLAKRLDLTDSFFDRNNKGVKQLNCSFESLPLKRKDSLLNISQ